MVHSGFRIGPYNIVLPVGDGQVIRIFISNNSSRFSCSPHNMPTGQHLDGMIHGPDVLPVVDYISPHVDQESAEIICRKQGVPAVGLFRIVNRCSVRENGRVRP